MPANASIKTDSMAPELPGVGINVAAFVAYIAKPTTVRQSSMPGVTYCPHSATSKKYGMSISVIGSTKQSANNSKNMSGRL